MLNMEHIYKADHERKHRETYKLKRHPSNARTIWRNDVVSAWIAHTQNTMPEIIDTTSLALAIQDNDRYFWMMKFPNTMPDTKACSWRLLKHLLRYTSVTAIKMMNLQNVPKFSR